MDERVLASWVEPGRHAWVLHPRDQGDWEEILATYGGTDGAAVSFGRVCEIVVANGCKTIVIENRYVDRDYRSEYAAFWAPRFTDTPAFARRLHFFASHIEDAQLHDLSDDCGYLGYAVLRPTPMGPLGRTMITPPAELADHVQARVRDVVYLFGNRLTVDAAPFQQQDTEFLACAQACAWMCHYTAVRRGLAARHETAQLVELAPSALSEERPLPGRGMNLNQLQAVFSALGQPALHYGLSTLPSVFGVPNPAPHRQSAFSRKAADPGYWDDRILSIICRYLNSRFPVLVATRDHTFVIVGWMRDRRGKIRFVGNDDRRGPYVDLNWPSYRAPWRSVMIPLPEKAYVTGEDAENHAWLRLQVAAKDTPSSELKQVAQAIGERKRYALFVSLQPSNEYKQRLGDIGLPEKIVRAVRLTGMPRFVWVAEALARSRPSSPPKHRAAAQVVFDSTSQPRRPRLLALVTPYDAHMFPADGGGSYTIPNEVAEWDSLLPLPVE